jgi:hypothetical protein
MTPTERGFRRIFWGLVFVVLDFELNGFNVLPDFLGFVLVTMGLGLLVPLHDRFRQARILAALLIVLSLKDFAVVSGVREPPSGFDGWTAFGIFVDVFDVAMVWLLCGGIVELARECDAPVLADVAATRRGLYLGLTIIAWVADHTLKDAPVPPIALHLGIGILSLVVMILLMGLMLRAARELGPIDDYEYEDEDHGDESC